MPIHGETLDAARELVDEATGEVTCPCCGETTWTAFRDHAAYVCILWVPDDTIPDTFPPEIRGKHPGMAAEADATVPSVVTCIGYSCEGCGFIRLHRFDS